MLDRQPELRAQLDAALERVAPGVVGDLLE
jgi:hypothetical protein